MAKATVYNQKGEKIKELELPSAIFELKPNQDLIYQALNAQQGGARQNLAAAKDRSQVSGGGKKPWRQKGTGRARHGSNRSPIWKGGGATFAPTGQENFAKKINKKMRQKAVFMVLSERVKNENLFILDGLSVKDQKTKEFSKIIDQLRTKVLKEEKPANLLLVGGGKTSDLVKVSKNLPKIRVIGANNLNVVDLLKSANLFMLEESLELIQKTYKA